MARPKLTVIAGGLLSPVGDKNKQLKMAYVTDTRLMGVLAIHAHWFLPDEPEKQDFHQFFYIDCEEAGLETYRSVRTDDFDGDGDIQQIEQSLIGGLGANKVNVTAAELGALLAFYTDFNMENNLPLPKGHHEYDFLLELGEQLDDDDCEQLMKKICGPIHSNNQVINYFLMRCFGHDYRAASRLRSGDFPMDLYDEYRRTSFCRNVIDLKQEYEDGAMEYLCESLIETENQYMVIVSRIVVRKMRVVVFENCSRFKISATEAAMILAKPEYVTVYEVLLDEDDMDNNIGELTITFNTIMTSHPNGRLFMAFKDTNAHVDNRVFLLSNDVNGVYYLTDFGQLIVAAYSLQEIRLMENKLKVSPLAPYLMTTAKYEFKEPILYEFINSDFEDFDDFLDAIRE
ncbi:MAG: hypothetical protein KBS66_05495 [Eubacterium sp.]|nr:hypothetical protein [Candidatus Colimonas fimequi]